MVTVSAEKVMRRNWAKFLSLAPLLLITYVIVAPNAVRCENWNDPWDCMARREEHSGKGYTMFPLSGQYGHMNVTTGTVQEPVFYLISNNGSLYRLLFYCKNEILITTRDAGPGIFHGYDFCTSVPFENDSRMTFRGTLVLPSEWNPELSTPRMTFTGDLYVIEVLT